VAKWIIKAPYIIKRLRELTENYSSENFSILFKNVGYSKSSAENYGRIIQDMFFGMGVGEIIKFFKKYYWIISYEDAKSVYMEEQGIKEIKSSRNKYYSKE